jgi:hypothetical protein
MLTACTVTWLRLVLLSVCEGLTYTTFLERVIHARLSLCALLTDALAPTVGRWLQWSTATLQKLDVPVDMQGKPWPLDETGKPILKD